MSDEHPRVSHGPRCRRTVPFAVGAVLAAAAAAAAVAGAAGLRGERPAGARAAGSASTAPCRVTTKGRPKPAPGPPRVHLPADQANHPAYHTDWWYVIGTLHAGRRTFGFITDIARISLSKGGLEAAESVNLISDVTAGRKYQKVVAFPTSSFSASSRRLDVHVPGTSLRGPMSAMTVRATIPGAALDLRLRSIGPPLYVGGIGYLRLAGGFSYYYSLPRLAATGTLMIGRRTFRVSGLSWLDHQYGNFAITTINWRWQAEQLDNGVSMNLGVVNPSPGRTVWPGAANVLLPNGRLFLTPITMQALPPVFHSKVTGNRYPTRWIVKIPTFGSCLTIVSRPLDQELIQPGAGSGFYEGVSTLSGTFRGRPVSGQAWNEQFLPPRRTLGGAPPGHGAP